MKVNRVDTWAATIKDKPGGLAAKLEVLAEGGVNLEFVIARRSSEKRGEAVVFVTPINGVDQARAAQKAGFSKVNSLHTVRAEGADKPGQGARITKVLAERGLNLRGLSAAAFARKFVVHIALDTAGDASKAARVLRSL